MKTKAYVKSISYSGRRLWARVGDYEVEMFAICEDKAKSIAEHISKHLDYSDVYISICEYNGKIMAFNTNSERDVFRCMMAGSSDVELVSSIMYSNTLQDIFNLLVEERHEGCLSCFTKTGFSKMIKLTREFNHDLPNTK